MDGGQIDDVESHVGDGFEARGGGGEGAGPRRIQARSLAAGKELVPRADKGSTPLHAQGPWPAGGDSLAQGVLVHDPADGRVGARGKAHGDR